MYKNLLNKLSKIEQNELPGIEAHSLMAPKIGDKIYRNMKAPAGVIRSAVLIPIVRRADSFDILFTQRSKKLLHHSGQISFPGGRIETGETPIDAALRETYEEIGIDRGQISIISQLSDLYVEPSNNLIFSFVGEISSPYELSISVDEVERVIPYPFEFFLNKDNRKHQNRQINGIDIQVPFWDIGADEPLWGATAMILSELIEIIQIK